MDAVVVTFNEAIRDSSVQPSDFSIDGVACDGLDSGTKDDTQVVLFLPVSTPRFGTHAALVQYTQGSLTDLAGNALATVAPTTAMDGAAPVLLHAVASDGGTPAAGPDAGDTVTLTFSEPTTGPLITAAVINAWLPLTTASGTSHSWLSGGGAIGGAVWSNGNRVLTVTLDTTGGAPTIADHDTITPDGASITDPVGLAASEPKAGVGTFEMTPVIHAICPDLVRAGIPIRIEGGNFDPTLANNTVRFAGTVATVLSATSTSLIARVPAAPVTAGSLEVQVGASTSPGFGYQLSLGTVSSRAAGRLQISNSGRFVVFGTSDGLIGADTNGLSDIYVLDRTTSAYTRVSVDSSGNQSLVGSSGEPSISADARYVAFHSQSSTLVAGDTNAHTDVFVHDRTTGQTTRVSVGPGGVEANDDSSFPAISADGRYVAFYSEATNLIAGGTVAVSNAFVHDRNTGQTTLVSVDSNGVEGNAPTRGPGGVAISADGRFVAFSSLATNLVPNDTNGQRDVFVRDRQAKCTERASGSGSTNPSDSPRLSADGRYAVFVRSNKVNVRDRAAGVTISVTPAEDGGDPDISSDGRYVVFQNILTQVRVFDLRTMTAKSVAFTAQGASGAFAGTTPRFGATAISGDGCSVVFITNLDFSTGVARPAAYVVANDLD